jgi:hypothetical protein
VTPEHSLAIEVLTKALGDQASLRLTPQGHTAEADTEIELRWRDKRPPDLVRLVSWPAKLPYALVPPLPPNGPVLWVLRRAPERLIAELRREGHNFVDARRGAVRLVLPGIMIDRTDLTPATPTRDPQRLRDPFADRASLVARVLFRYPDRDWKTRELASAAGVSPMMASHVVRQLADWEIVDATRPGREARIRLRSERRLIEVWSAHYDWQKNPQLAFAVPMGAPTRFLQRLPDSLAKRRWALTMQAGASLIAPHATWDKVHIYVDVPSARDLRSVATSAGWSPDPAGRMVLMQPWYDHSVWTELQTVHRLPVVGTLQLVLDLWHYPVRGREQAEHLLVHLASRKRRAERNA